MWAAAEPASGCSPQRGALRTYRAQTAAALIRLALNWLEGLLGVELRTAPDSFADLFLLGRVAEAVQAARRGEPRPPPPHPRPAHRSFKQRIHDYLAFQQLCRDLGVRPDLLPQLNDVEQGRGAAAVAACVQAVAEQCTALGLPVPRFDGDGGSLRGSMPRVMSARRAEAFSHKGPSPVKRPALGPLLTPRAYLASPVGSARSAFRESNSRLGGWQQGGEGAADARKAAPRQQQRAGQQEQVAPARSDLARTVAALDRAAAEAGSAAAELQQLRRPPPAAQQQQQQQQQWRRPVLPRLDIAAAAAQAAAEASARGGADGAADWGSASPSPSPLSSPTSSMGSPGGGYISSCSQLSSPQCSPSPGGGGAPGASPSRHRITPGRLLSAAHTNPLWIASPREHAAPAAPAAGGDDGSRGAAWRGRGAAAAAPSLLGISGRAHWRQGSGVEASPADGAGGVPVRSTATLPPAGSPAAGVPPPAVQPAGSSLQPGSGSPAGGGGSVQASWEDGGGLLESLLCPPQLKPAHSHLLGALMHTSAGPRRPAAAGAGEEGEGEEEEEEAAVQQAAAAPPGAAAHGTKAAAGQRAAAPSSAGHRHGGGMRRLALLALGAAAGAAAAVAAGMVQQQRQDAGVRSRGIVVHRHPQRVPPLCEGERVVHAAAPAVEQQAAEQQAAEQQQPASGTWDSPHALFTQG